MTKLKLKFNSLAGFVDPISIIGVLFLIITLSVGAHVVDDKKYDFNIFEKGAKKAIIPDEEWTDLPPKTIKPDFSDKNFYKLEKDEKEFIEERQDDSFNQSNNSKPPPKQREEKNHVKRPTPRPITISRGCYLDNGTTLPQGVVTVYSSGDNDYRMCGPNGWTTTCADGQKCELVDVSPEIVPVYLKPQYQEAIDNLVQQQQNVDQIDNKLESEESSFIQEVVEQEAKTQAAIQTQPTTNTQITNSFANVTAGVSGGTMQEVPTITSNQINQYVPPLLTTVPTAEDLLKKLPGLENLNINDFKELNYPTINKPDPAIITNKYGIVGAYANDPVRCKYGNGAIKEGDGKYACPTDTFANPILDNSQNISWYDQPLDIPALEFNLESTEPTVESEIKKLTDPLFNYILDYFNWGIIDKITTSGQNVTEGAGSETALPKLPSDIKDIPSGFSDYTDSSENHVETLRGGKELFIDISGTVKLITDKNMNEQFYTVPDKVDYIQTNVTDSKGELIEQKVFWIAPTDVAQSTGNPTIVMENRNYSTNTHRYTYYEANLEDNITDSWAVVYSGGCVLPSCVNKVATWWENQKIKATFIWDDILGQPHSMPSP